MVATAFIIGMVFLHTALTARLRNILRSDACYMSGGCTRFVLQGQVLSGDDQGDHIKLCFRSCGVQDNKKRSPIRSLPKRVAYGELGYCTVFRRIAINGTQIWADVNGGGGILDSAYGVFAQVSDFQQGMHFKRIRLQDLPSSENATDLWKGWEVQPLAKEPKENLPRVKQGTGATFNVSDAATPNVNGVYTLVSEGGNGMPSFKNADGVGVGFHQGNWYFHDFKGGAYYKTSENIPTSLQRMAYHHPPLDDTQLEAVMPSGRTAEPEALSTAAALGALSWQELADELTKMSNSLHGESMQSLGKNASAVHEVRLVFDVRASEGKAFCPAAKEISSGAYNAHDHFKLMILAAGPTCAEIARHERVDTAAQLYCFDQGHMFGGPMRAWAVVVDLEQALPLVRNPELEKNKGRAYMNCPADTLEVNISDLVNGTPKEGNSCMGKLENGSCTTWLQAPQMLNFKPDRVPELHNKTVRELLQHPTYERFCRYQSFTAKQWKKEAYAKQAERARVIINANFFFFLHVPALPCATPVGPTISNGVEIMMQPETESIFWDEHYGVAAFTRVQTTGVLVFYRGSKGPNTVTTMPVLDFHDWFRSLPRNKKKRVNAVTGHVIMRNGQPVNECARFQEIANTMGEKGGYIANWCSGKDARSVVGFQYDGNCPHPLPPRLKCGSKLVVANFEKQSSGKGLWNAFNPAEPEMDDKDRPSSLGASVPEMQDVMAFMMMDEVLNLDSSGSSGFWTDLASSTGGDFRSQPKDMAPGGTYRFRPSPTLLGFE